MADLRLVGRRRVGRKATAGLRLDACSRLHKNIAAHAIIAAVTAVVAETLGAAVPDLRVGVGCLPTLQKDRASTAHHIDGTTVTVAELAVRIGICMDVETTVTNLDESPVAVEAAANHGDVTAGEHTDVTGAGARTVERVGRIEGVDSATVGGGTTPLWRGGVAFTPSVADHRVGFGAAPFKVDLA